MPTMHIYVSDHIYKLLQKQAIEWGVSPAKAAQIILREYLLK